MWGLFRNKCPSKKDIYSARAAAAAPCLLGRHGAGAILIEFCTLPQRATQIYILSSCDSCTIVVNRLNKNGGVCADRRNSNFCKKKLSFDTKKRKEKKMDQRNLSFRASNIQSRAERVCSSSARSLWFCFLWRASVDRKILFRLRFRLSFFSC